MRTCLFLIYSHKMRKPNMFVLQDVYDYTMFSLELMSNILGRFKLKTQYKQSNVFQFLIKTPSYIFEKKRRILHFIVNFQERVAGCSTNDNRILEFYAKNVANYCKLFLCLNPHSYIRNFSSLNSRTKAHKLQSSNCLVSRTKVVTVTQSSDK